MTSTDPTLLVIALFRHVALVAGCYLALVTSAGALARLARLRRVTRAVDRVTLPSLRRLLDTALGASVVATVVASPAAWAEPPEHPPPTMVRLPHAEEDGRPLEQTSTTASTTTTTTTTTEPPVATTVATTAPFTTTTTATTAAAATPSSTTTPTPTTEAAPSSTTSTTATSVPPPARAPTPPRDTPASPSSSGAEWTVQPGDHFWSIAERVLQTAWQRAPGDTDVAPYWRTLVEANRDRLADRDNPDLLFADQVLLVPTPAPP